LEKLLPASRGASSKRGYQRMVPADLYYHVSASRDELYALDSNHIRARGGKINTVLHVPRGAAWHTHCRVLLKIKWVSIHLLLIEKMDYNMRMAVEIKLDGCIVIYL